MLALEVVNKTSPCQERDRRTSQHKTARAVTTVGQKEGRLPARLQEASRQAVRPPIRPRGALPGGVRLPGTEGAEKCILGESKGKAKARLVCRNVPCWEPASRTVWLKNQKVVQSQVGKTGRNYEKPGMHATTFNLYPTENGNSIMVPSSGSAIQA